jgi:glutamate 5-kinase
MIPTKRTPSTLVIALSSSFVCDIHTSLGRISQVVETVHALIELDHRVILVTGGALGIGSRALAKQVSPESHAALTAVGQAKLIRLYSDLFARVNQPVGQLILSQQDLFISCLDELCTIKVVPICHAVKKKKKKSSPPQKKVRETDPSL